MAKPRIVLSDAELLEYSKEHVFYELWMLIRSADLLGETVVTPSGLMRPPYWNAALESFVLHLRNLVDFLYPTNIKPKDVLADDFFPQRLRPSGFPTIPPLLAAARGRAHKQLSHLTTDRLPEGHPQKGWKRGELLLAISPLIVTFAQQAAPTKLHVQTSEFIIRAFRGGAQKWAQSADQDEGDVGATQ
jgi:hypothetical protein